MPLLRELDPDQGSRRPRPSLAADDLSVPKCSVTRTEVKPFYHVLRLPFNKILGNDALCFKCTKNFGFSFANAFTGNRRELANALVKSQRRARPFFRHRLVFNSQKIATVACIELRVYNGTRSDKGKPPDRKAPMGFGLNDEDEISIKISPNLLALGTILCLGRLTN